MYIKYSFQSRPLGEGTAEKLSLYSKYGTNILISDQTILESMTKLSWTSHLSSYTALFHTHMLKHPNKNYVRMWDILTRMNRLKLQVSAIRSCLPLNDSLVGFIINLFRFNTTSSPWTCLCSHIFKTIILVHISKQLQD